MISSNGAAKTSPTTRCRATSSSPISPRPAPVRSKNSSSEKWPRKADVLPGAGPVAAFAITCYILLMNYQAIRNGLPASDVKALVKDGTLNEADIYSVIPERTFKRRLEKRAKLKLEEADAIARLVR